MKPSQDRIDRLPKWARIYTQQLENRIERMIEDNRIKQEAIDSRTTGVEWSERGIRKKSAPLPKHSVVWFGERPNRVSVYFHDGRIRLSADNTLVIRPGGGVNVVYVESADH